MVKKNKEVERFVTKMANWASLFCRLPSLFLMSRQFSFCRVSHDPPVVTSFLPYPDDSNPRSAGALQAWMGIRKEEWASRESHRGLNGIPLADLVGRPCLDLQAVARFYQAVAPRGRG